jgi:hypothetical protein
MENSFSPLSFNSLSLSKRARVERTTGGEGCVIASEHSRALFVREGREKEREKEREREGEIDPKREEEISSGYCPFGRSLSPMEGGPPPKEEKKSKKIPVSCSCLFM